MIEIKMKSGRKIEEHEKRKREVIEGRIMQRITQGKMTGGNKEIDSELQQKR